MPKKKAEDQETQDLKKELTAPRKRETPLINKDLLHSGSTLLNLQCTGKANGAYPKGSYTHIVGDSDAGKSFLALTAFAEASIDSKFDNYRFIYYEGESNDIDIETFFGPKAAKRIEKIDVGTQEEFYFDAWKQLKSGKPCITILDSMDALTPQVDMDKFEEDQKAHDKGKDTSGSYGMAKAKSNSARLRMICNELRETDSILLIVSQTRENIGYGAQFNPKVYSGGTALKFYSKLQMWLAVKGDIKKTVKGKDRQLGINAQIRIRKNHVNGKKGAIEFPLYHSFGIDDIGSCIEYLIDEKVWVGTDKKVSAPDFKFEGTQEKLIEKIRDEDLDKDLRMLVSETWNDIQNQCKVNRKSRYH